MADNKIVDEIIILPSGDITIVEKIETSNLDGVIIATAYSRRTIKVGQDTTTETPRVQQVAALVHSEAFLGIPITPPQTADWDAFNAQMLADTDFNAVYATASRASPVLAASLPAALTQVSTGQIYMFTTVWEQIMTLGGATQTQRDAWGVFAADAQLPQVFIDIIVGNTNG